MEYAVERTNPILWLEYIQLGESFRKETAEGAVDTASGGICKRSGKRTGAFNSVGERFLEAQETHRRGKRCIASVNLSGKADNRVPVAVHRGL
jgi:hypothetical protein